MRKIALLLLISVCFCSAVSALNYEAVYVINLDRSPERFDQMKKQLDKFGVKFRRFRAIDGYGIKITNMRTGKIEDNKQFHKNRDKRSKYLVQGKHAALQYKPMANNDILCCGELGCALSHLEIWRDVVKNNYQSVLVFEDDISFEKNFPEILAATLKNTPSNVDILFLDVGIRYDHSSPHFVNPGALLKCFERLYPDNEYVVRFSDSKAFGTHAYMITLNGAKKILQNSKIIRRPIDIHMMEIDGILRYVARKKMLYVNKEAVSEIYNMGRGYCFTPSGIVVNRDK